MGIKTLKMTDEEKRHFKKLGNDMRNAEVAYHLAGEYAVGTLRLFWDEFNKHYNIDSSKQSPSIDWVIGEITYRDDDNKHRNRNGKMYINK